VHEHLRVPQQVEEGAKLKEGVAIKEQRNVGADIPQSMYTVSGRTGKVWTSGKVFFIITFSFPPQATTARRTAATEALSDLLNEVNKTNATLTLLPSVTCESTPLCPSSYLRHLATSQLHS
jgi:hypothetical protein